MEKATSQAPCLILSFYNIYKVVGICSQIKHILFLDIGCYLILIVPEMARNSLAISEKDGRDLGSGDQHLSISDLHAGSHQLGISGCSVPLTF